MNTIRKCCNFFLLLTLFVLATLLFSSCKKTCRCYHYNGNVYEYSQEELDEMDYTCTGLENLSMGTKYSLCEYVF